MHIVEYCSIFKYLTFFPFPQNCNNLRTGLYQDLLWGHRKLKTDQGKLKGTVLEHYNKLVARNKDLECKFFLRPNLCLIRTTVSHLNEPFMLSELISCPNLILSEPLSIQTNSYLNCLAAEKQKLVGSHKAEMAKLVEEHAAELEQKEDEIYKARQIAQEANRKYDSAEGNYNKMKKSLALTGEHVKQMEGEQESWRSFLKDMDQQLSRKLDFFLCYISLFSLGRSLYISFSFLQLVSLLRMQELPQRLQPFGKREPSRFRACHLSGRWRIGYTL